MSILSISYKGIKKSGQLSKINLSILFIQLILSGLIGVLSFYYIQCSIGSSVNLLKIIDGYNHDVLQDLLRAEGTGWEMIKSFISLLMVLYLFIGPYIMGGVLYALYNDVDGWKVFWKGGSTYYWIFFKVNAVIFVLFLMLLGIFAYSGLNMLTKGLEYFISEIPVLYLLGGLSLLFVLAMTLLVAISTRTKWTLMQNESGMLASLQSNASFVLKKSFYFMMMGLLFLIVSLLFATAINWLINLIPESNTLLVFAALILQFSALYIRIWLRNGYYAAIIA